MKCRKKSKQAYTREYSKFSTGIFGKMFAEITLRKYTHTHNIYYYFKILFLYVYIENGFSFLTFKRSHLRMAFNAQMMYLNNM